MTKLTLSVDEGVIERAKAFAAGQGTSVSRLVEQYLDLMVRGSAGPREKLPPVTRRLSGVLQGARLDRAEYRRHIERKYR